MIRDLLLWIPLFVVVFAVGVAVMGLVSTFLAMFGLSFLETLCHVVSALR